MVPISNPMSARHRSLRAPLAFVMAAALVAWMSLSVLGAPAAHAAGVTYSFGDVMVAETSDTIQHYNSSGTLLDTLHTTTGAAFDTGMCFDSSGNLFATNFGDNSITKFDNAGNVVSARFVSGINADPESCLFDKSGNLYQGTADGTHQVHKYDASGTLLATYSPATEARGTDWIDLAADQCTIHYTSEGSSVKRFNACTNTQLADFATGLSAPCYALRILPGSGDVLVACTSQVYHLSSTGAIVQTYSAASIGSNGSLFALNIDPDGTSFWTADFNGGRVMHVDIATGNLLGSFTTNTSVFGLAIFGEKTAANPCSGDTTAPAISFTRIMDVNGKPAVQVTASDPDNALATALASGSNLQIINNTSGATLQTLTSTLTTVAGFVANSSQSFTFVAEKINASFSAEIAVQSTDLCSNVGNGDPILHGRGLHGHASADHRSVIVDIDE
ncbi:MAG TPA: hypothetical protein VKQ30_17705 [Ktedonobacterales bacterium]|nr:hypothetical protein [Ktedonobacterales bacterium]